MVVVGEWRIIHFEYVVIDMFSMLQKMAPTHSHMDMIVYIRKNKNIEVRGATY